MKTSFRILLIVAVVLVVGLLVGFALIPECESPANHIGFVPSGDNLDPADSYNVYVNNVFIGKFVVSAGAPVYPTLFYADPKQNVCLKTH